MSKTVTQSRDVKHNLVNIMAERYAIDEDSVVDILKSTAFKQSKAGQVITNEQIYALMVVANQYGLNPFVREIYAFPDKKGGIIPVVGVDGWNRIANDHSQFDGIEFNYSNELVEPEGARPYCPAWIDAKLYRKDRGRPTVIREYLDECYRAPFKDSGTGYTVSGPWQTHPKRMLRHKALIQCYRVGFAMVGIYDEDEAGCILEAETGVQSATVIAMPRRAETRAVEVVDAQRVEEVFTIDFDQGQVDSFVAKLEKRARASSQWQAARDLADERLQGNAAKYAVQKLMDAENGHPANPEPGAEQAPGNAEKTTPVAEPAPPESSLIAEAAGDIQTSSMF